MPKPESGANRSQLRVWLKWAIESGLLDKLPTHYDPDPEGWHDPEPTDGYARRLLAELRDPDSSRRPPSQVLAEVRRFRAWVEERQKIGVRIILAGMPPRDASSREPHGRPSARTRPEGRPRPGQPGSTHPKSHPMWDDWLDG
ncbi:MAG TPA: hypothetical protein VFF52_11035 [Isosphaeraceae bacterium]|nr:hypothetical protein [Isosphaeraceae bacterium]